MTRRDDVRRWTGGDRRCRGGRALRFGLATALALFSFACAPARAPHDSTGAPPSVNVPPAVADDSPGGREGVRCPVPPIEVAKRVGPPPPHRGPGQPFLPSPIERWSSALQGYVPRVTPGNQIPLDGTAGCWAVYLNEMHKRIHPLFADSFLATLDA